MIQLWSRYGAKGAKSYEAEARSFAELMIGSTSRNLVRVFFLQNRLKSQGNKPQSKIERVHVIGAGVMGGDIAAWCALRGLQVTLQDRASEYIDPAMQRAAKLFSKRIRDANDRAAATDRLVADFAGDGVADADLIIEAIYEDLDAKQTLYKTVQASMKPDAILATNTSSIRLEELRTVLDRPDRFVGLHFFNPVPQLPLVEVIRCDDTQQDVLDSGFGFVKRIGKFPLECASSPGFVVNRVLAPYMLEAINLLEEGHSMATVDEAAKRFGMPMGPVELVDTVGLDVALSVVKKLAPDRQEAIAKLEALIDEGKLGKKSGEGFYRWKKGKPDKGKASDMVAMDILGDRLIKPLLTECQRCLDDGIVDSADLLDAGVIFGTGFAPFLGGPMHYLEHQQSEVKP